MEYQCKYTFLQKVFYKKKTVFTHLLSDGLRLNFWRVNNKDSEDILMQQKRSLKAEISLLI